MNIPQYDFKILPEIVWAAVIAASMALFQALVIFEPNEIEDWQFWAVSLGSGIVRAVAAAALAVIGARVASGGGD